ncbi:MAG: hypothetical protein N3A65_07395 [candidate division WOR-3 bacterium]|nr:hypothetical protein [candidate division WOR-3 bacterium]
MTSSPIILLFLSVEFEPTLVKVDEYKYDPFVIYSSNHQYYALITYDIGNSEFVPFDQFILKDNSGRTLYSKSKFNHTVVDISNEGWVVASDFDGPVSGKAILHFYNPHGIKIQTAAVGFLGQRTFSFDGSTYCILDGLHGLRVFRKDGTPLYNLGSGNSFAVSDDGSHLALAKDNEIAIFFIGNKIRTIPISSPFIRQMKFSKDNRLLGFIDRKNLYVYSVVDHKLFLRYEEKKPERNFISFDIAPDNSILITGLDEDYGRNSGKRHENGYIYIFDLNNGDLVWNTIIKYKNWDITIPEVRFEDEKLFWIRTDTRILRYSINQ